MARKGFTPGPIPRGHVVEEYKFGNTTCRICDDYCRDKTPAEVQAILDRCAEIAYRALLNEEIRKSKEKQENVS